MPYQEITYQDILEGSKSFYVSDYVFTKHKKQKKILYKKYKNILDYMNNFDGFPFSSNSYMTKNDSINQTPLLQIGNVNKGFVIDNSQSFEYLPNKFLQTKNRYLLKEKHVVISLTGGKEYKKNISSFFDNDFLIFLNQRVSAFSVKNNNFDLLFYFYALTKHDFFRIQWLGSGGIQKNTVAKERKNTFLPLITNKEIIRYVSFLTRAIINKEKEIRKKHKEILEQIEKELSDNQKDKNFNYELPNFKEIRNSNRVDVGYYCKDYQEKQYLIKNYKEGAKELMDWGYSSKRGQNLQISQIGKSIYSDTLKDDFYTLVRPTNFSEFGTVEKFEYLGNPKELSNLDAGDIVFSAEGTIGKCILFTDLKSRWITNIHGIVLKKKEQDIIESAFISCFLRFLRNFGVLDYISVGGQGGSLAKKYWKDILIPNFPKQKQKDIVSLYHNQIDYPKSLNLVNFLEEDQKWNEKSGIIEVDKSMKKIKIHLNGILDKIVNDKIVNLTFDKL